MKKHHLPKEFFEIEYLGRPLHWCDECAEATNEYPDYSGKLIRHKYKICALDGKRIEKVCRMEHFEE